MLKNSRYLSIPVRFGVILILLAGVLAWFPAAVALADMPSGSLDIGFDPGTGADNNISAVALQPDGKVVIGGNFFNVDGTARSHIARLNANGTLDTTFDPGTGLGPGLFWVSAIAIQSDGKILIGGDFTTFDGVARNNIARLNTDGSLDTDFLDGLAGPNDSIDSIAVQADGKVLIVGDFTQVNGVGRNRVARLDTDGSLDTSFDPGTGPNGIMSSVVVQPDGKALIAGGFTQVNGTIRWRIARLNTDGSLDTSFDTSTGPNNSVYDLALQTDGKIVIGGRFTEVNGITRIRVARLNSNGSLDTSFDVGDGADNWVRAVAVQADGKVLLGGDFAQVDSTARNYIARLSSNGSLDTGFDPGAGANSGVRDVVVQTDGQVLIGGSFTQVDGIGRGRIARLNPDGSLEVGFDPGAGTNSFVYAVATQSDDKVLIGGAFTTVGGVGRNRLARLNTTGSLDTSFLNGLTGANGTVYAMAVQPDDKVLIGGEFTQVNGITRNGIARLNANGSLDSSFNPGTGVSGGVASVSTIALQPDGKVLIGGGFTTVNGMARGNIARLNTGGSLDAGFLNGLAGASSTVSTIALQPDGKVLLGGGFIQVNSTARNRIARLNTDGSLDTGFDPGSGTNNTVNDVAVKADGKIIIVGNFDTFNGVTRNRIAQLNTDGSLDTGFDPGAGASGLVWTVVPLGNNKALIAGTFSQINGTARNRIAQLNADGSLDTNFDPGTGANNWVMAVDIQSDDKVLIGGGFTTFDGTGRIRVARLHGSSSDTGLYLPLILRQ
jgi:uncharacterized delta-60 repeat protein